MSVQAHGVCGDEFVFHLHVSVCVSVFAYLYVCIFMCLEIDGMVWR